MQMAQNMEQNAEVTTSNTNLDKDSNDGGSETVDDRKNCFYTNFENNVTMCTNELLDMLFGDFDSTKPTEKYSPIYIYFAFKRLLEYTEKIPNDELNLSRKRVILNKIEKVSEILRRGPPKVVKCPPWSRNIPSFRDETLDDSNAKGVNNKQNVTKESQPSNSPKSRGAGINIFLSTHVWNDRYAIKSQEVFFPFGAIGTTTKKPTAPKKKRR